ncbi:CaiB/BaiF CoA-transferase family protein [Nocardioides sp.]|uniref:CaiB/BaiF CoA transferase family protein n=1 Tax=Nocardioides sp. TaxID=35761 RepID=UPI0026280702|nr:CaiB/BaiF CoA-transferase family protein [Nocardioides sp.]
MELGQGTGPLAGVRVVEIAGIGPGPHACTILADLGADVIRIDRATAVKPGVRGLLDLTNRGRPSVALDLKHPEAVETVLRLVESADVLIEGMRPGVTERLGLGPDVCLERNPRLVYGRMTGWGQDGPLAHASGHDLTYLATMGGLFNLGQDAARPHFPLNLAGDFGGGSTYLVIGVLAALLEAKVSGRGQVVDAAIVDGAAHLSTMSIAHQRMGILAEDQRLGGLLDGGTPYYDVYECADGRHVAVGALEPQFFAELVRLLEIDLPGQWEVDRLPEMRERLAATFKTRTMAEWAELFEGTDACVAPVLTLPEAADHPHLRARQTYVEADGIVQPAPAPRFSRTAPTLSMPPAKGPGEHTREALEAWGISDVEGLIRAGVAVQA